MIPRIVIDKEDYNLLYKEFCLQGMNFDDRLTRLSFKEAVRKLFVKEEQRIGKIKKEGEVLKIKTIELDGSLVYIVVDKDLVEGKYPLFQLGLGYFKCGKALEHEEAITFLMGLKRLAEKNHFNLKSEMEVIEVKWKNRIK